MEEMSKYNQAYSGSILTVFAMANLVILIVVSIYLAVNNAEIHRKVSVVSRQCHFIWDIQTNKHNEH